MTKKLTAEEKQNRKPINTACVFCHKKHLQCDVGRPCTNCVKRGLGDTCQDKERKVRSRSTRKIKKEDDVDSDSAMPVVKPVQLNKIGVIPIVPDSKGKPPISVMRSIKASHPAIVKKPRLSKLTMDSIPVPLTTASIGSPSEMFNKQKKVLSPELPRIPSLTQLFNPSAEPIIADALLPSNHNSGMSLPSLVDKLPIGMKEKSSEQLSLTNPGSQSSGNTSTNGEFGSIWTTEEYTKLNDMLSTPNLSRNNSKVFLSSGATWSPNNMMKMDAIVESPRLINTQDLLLSLIHI